MIKDVELSVGHMPGRKRPCLTLRIGGAVHVLAYFVSEHAMQEFLNLGPRYVSPNGLDGEISE